MKSNPLNVAEKLGKMLEVTGAIGEQVAAFDQDMSEARGAWIQTYSGIAFFPLDPRPEEIRIEDITHALSNQCRFTGHVREFYSIAQHSIHVAQLVPKELQLRALLHDASEAYICDLSRPVKRLAQMQPYRGIEAHLQKAIYHRFGIHGSDPDEIKKADAQALGDEALNFMSPLVQPEHWKWATDLATGAKLVALAPKDAERAFLDAFWFICHGGVL